MNKGTIGLPSGQKPRHNPGFSKPAQQSAPAKPEQRIQLDGHSKRLRDLQKTGSPVTFWMASGIVLEGKVVGFDKYTVTIETDVDLQGNTVNRPITVTVYKSAMEAFSSEAAVS